MIANFLGDTETKIYKIEKAMKAIFSAIILYLGVFYYPSISFAQQDDLPALKLDVDSPSFKNVLRYGISQALLSTFELNCLSPAAGNDTVQLTKKAHEALGRAVKIHIFANREDDGIILIDVFFPEFKYGDREFVLRFSKTGETYLYLEQGFDWELLRSDFTNEDRETILPIDYKSIIKAEFRLNPIETARLQNWCREMIKNDYPSDLNKTNHFMVAPFNARYDSYQASVYWLEKEKVVHFEVISDPDNKHIDWKLLDDFSALNAPKEGADSMAATEWRKFVIAKHVTDGLPITVNPINR